MLPFLKHFLDGVEVVRLLLQVHLEVDLSFFLLEFPPPGLLEGVLLGRGSGVLVELGKDLLLHHEAVYFVVEVSIAAVVVALQHLDCGLAGVRVTMYNCTSCITSSIEGSGIVPRWISSFMTSQAKSGLALSSSLLLSSQKSTICTLSLPPALLLLSMSFEKEYIEKYRQRAIEAYKRSLEHSDLP